MPKELCQREVDLLFLCSENVFHKYHIVLNPYCEYYKLKQSCLWKWKNKFQIRQN